MRTIPATRSQPAHQHGPQRERQQIACRRTKKVGQTPFATGQHGHADGRFQRFESLFEPREGRLGVVVTFLAILELAKEQLLDIVQEAPSAPIYLKSLALNNTYQRSPPHVSMPMSMANACPMGACQS